MELRTSTIIGDGLKGINLINGHVIDDVMSPRKVKLVTRWANTRIESNLNKKAMLSQGNRAMPL